MKVHQSSLGVLFDWDGVIVDSSRQHEESWQRLARERNYLLPSGHFRKGFGKKTEWVIEHQLGWASKTTEVRQLALRKEALYREIIAERGANLLPGVGAFIERLCAAAVPCCIASSTHRQNIELILKLSDLEGCFAGMVTAEDVSQGKPDPEVFLKAAAKIECRPEHCVVFEDAIVGIEAATAGGMKVVGVTTTHRRDELESRVDRVVRRLDELEVVDLLGLLS